ncbi:MAG: hypothetical protein ACI8Y4_002250 [Candidatus Poriferisodalaceae bacterium]
MEDRWHLGLRAWNCGPPPLPGVERLSVLEDELTNLLIAAEVHPPHVPLFGADGVASSLIESTCPGIVDSAPEDAAVALEALLLPRLHDVDTAVAADLLQLAPTVAVTDAADERDLALRLLAPPMADGAVALNLLLPQTGFSGIVTSLWLTAVAGSVGAGLVLRSQAAALHAFQREVNTAMAGDFNGTEPLRLSNFLFAVVKLADRRSSSPR